MQSEQSTQTPHSQTDTTKLVRRDGKSPPTRTQSQQLGNFNNYRNICLCATKCGSKLQFLNTARHQDPGCSISLSNQRWLMCGERGGGGTQACRSQPWGRLFWFSLSNENASLLSSSQ
ncbi:hypothetical protein CRENBAI_004819 [Crenichthys baileyi]|uniref:Uncharacterized protein n=1 Tax=Crenichthys baileyi TaxID=28760 RepID=A0AAV9SLZ7_9TELE